MPQLESHLREVLITKLRDEVSGLAPRLLRTFERRFNPPGRVWKRRDSVDAECTAAMAAAMKVANLFRCAAAAGWSVG